MQAQSEILEVNAPGSLPNLYCSNERTEGEGQGRLKNIFSKMEDNQVSVGCNNSDLNDENIQNQPAVVALPAVSAPSGGDRAESPMQTPTIAENHPVVSEEQIWEWDEAYMLPLGSVMSTMRKALPADAGVPDDVAGIIQRGTSDFILLVTCQARERCRNERRQKIRGDDIIWALKKLGFANYVDPLELYLSRYKAMHSGDSTASSSMLTQSEPSQKKKK